jgi:hypothetical protein
MEPGKVMTLLNTLKRWWVNLLKRGDDLVDIFKPRGDVEARLIYAHGPLKGQVASVHKGRNIVTSWLSVGGAAPTSGRDMLRRIIVPTAFAGSLASDSSAVFKSVELGSGVTAETTADTGLVAAIGPSTLKDFTSVTFDALNPYVTFIAVYDETEANATITELGLYSGRSPADFLARKTIGAFTKTSDFTLEVRWTIRF